MNVLIACEYSGTVRDAFINAGHDAVSCDLLPTEKPGPHYQGDVLDIIGDGWDLMIAHPPCTHLAVSGARWFPEKKKQQREALAFVRALMLAPIPRICIENPLSIISSKIRPADQVVQPWQFGHPEAKATCFWLKNLPHLKQTGLAVSSRYRCGCGYVFNIDYLGLYGCPNCEGEEAEAGRYVWDNQTDSGQNALTPSPDRWKERSRTYEGIAQAMAQQWGQLTPVQLEIF